MNREKILWYGNRLRSMPKKEIFHRVREAVEMRRPLPASMKPGVKTIASVPDEKRLLNVWSSLWSEEVSEFCRRQAVAAVSGNISVFGHEWSTATKEWNVDPVSGYKWPSVPAHKIDYRHSLGADPKWTWEVNRLLFLVPVAFAAEAGVIERKDAHEFITSIVADWIVNCPAGRGPQWSASIEVAIRSIAMTVAMQAVEKPSAQLIKDVGVSIREHANWIKRFPSAYSSANNHRIAELAALLILDSSWEGILNDLERLKFELELSQVSRTLFSSDGIGLEQSPTYAGFSLEFLALVLNCRTWSSPENRREVAGIVAQASYALTQFTNEDGSLIRYGDDDEGKVVTVAVPDSEYAQSLARLSTGQRGVRDRGLTTFAEGGVSLLRFVDGEDETTWLFDHGPLGFGSIAAHGHADALAVSMRSAGATWVVDAGTYRYHGDKTWRTYFRSSRAHNAPQLDGLDSSVMTGDFNWDPRKRALGRLIISHTDGERVRVQATHDGYQKQGMGSVVRTLERIADGHYRISDAHDSGHELSTAFMLDPSCDVEEIPNGWRISRSDSLLEIQLTVFGHTSVSLDRPVNETAWFSPEFGTKLPTWRLGAVAELRGTEPQLLVFDFKFLNLHYQEAQR